MFICEYIKHILYNSSYFFSLIILAITNAINENITLHPLTSDIAPSSPSDGRFTITPDFSGNLKGFEIYGGLLKWELSNNGSRVDAVPIFCFSMDNKTSLRVAFKTTGSTTKSVNKVQLTIMLRKKIII